MSRGEGGGGKIRSDAEGGDDFDSCYFIVKKCGRYPIKPINNQYCVRIRFESSVCALLMRSR